MVNTVGRKIFYDLGTGNILLDTMEKENAVIMTTIEQYIATSPILYNRDRTTFDAIELPFGAYKQLFASCNGYKMNVETKTLEFNFDPILDIEQCKKMKIEELQKRCQEDIEGGFISQLNNHHYRTNGDDQLNLLGKFNQLMNDSTITTVMWKTEDEGYIEHDRDTWLQIYNEALAAKETKLFKYDQLKKQVNVAMTKEEVEAIVW